MHITYLSGPQWTDDCHHPKDSYLCSFECITNRREVCDFYLFWSPEGRQDVCIRFGEEPGDYWSIGTTVDLIKHSAHEPYTTALAILSEKGRILWTVHGPEPKNLSIGKKGEPHA